MVLLVILLFLIAAATVLHFTTENDTAREAALRIETAKAVQSQRAREDARCVIQAAAQEPAKRKHRKVL